jgi:hypothetical protein
VYLCSGYALSSSVDFSHEANRTWGEFSQENSKLDREMKRSNGKRYRDVP